MQILEFFQGKDGKLSMERLIWFLAFLPSTGYLFAHPSNEVFGMYLGAHVMGFVIRGVGSKNAKNT